MHTITNVEYLNNYILKIDFSDNTNKIIDFDIYLKLYSNNAIVAEFISMDKFKTYKFTDTVLSWGEEFVLTAQSLFSDDWSVEGMVKSRIKVLDFANNNGLLETKQYIKLLGAANSYL